MLKAHNILILTALLICLMLSLSISSANPWQLQLPWHLNETIWQLRFTRTVSAFVCGGSLALAGCLMQVLLRNPLADPYVLGVSGGAAVMMLFGMLLGFSGLYLTSSALVGALVSILLVFAIAQYKHAWSNQRLLLTGVVLAAGWGALISFILSISPQEKLPSMLFWLMGDISNASLPKLSALLLLFSFIASFYLAPKLNILIRGELSATSLGLETKRLNLQIYLLSSLLTAVAVTSAGNIGFIGLIVPHMLRLALKTSDHRLLLPLSVLAGGSLLVLADSIARTIIAPQQLPVGIITALIGVPVFLVLLKSQ